jgi:hypothetical protein
MTRQIMKRIIIIFLISSAGLTVTAQFEKIIQPSDLKQQTIINEPLTLRKGFFRTGIEISYTVKDKYFNGEGSREYRPASIWGVFYNYDFSLQYGLSDRFEIDLYVPLVNNRNEGTTQKIQPVLSTDVAEPTSQKSKGIGDCNIGIYYQIIPEREKRFSLTLSGDFSFPTGKKDITDIKDLYNYNLPTGQGNFRVGSGLYARKTIYPYSFSAGIEYYYNFKGTKLINPEDFRQTEFKSGNLFLSSGSFSLHLNEWIALANEIQFLYRAKGREEYMIVRITDPRWDIDYMPRLVFQIRRFRVSQFVMIPLLGKNMDADPKYSMSVQYTF